MSTEQEPFVVLRLGWLLEENDTNNNSKLVLLLPITGDNKRLSVARCYMKRLVDTLCSCPDDGYPEAHAVGELLRQNYQSAAQSPQQSYEVEFFQQLEARFASSPPLFGSLS